jgi:REP element-mobilizing transposase RayT
MPDHCHLLLRDNNVVEFMRLFKGKLTPVARTLESRRTLWQRSFYDHALRSTESIFEVSGYIWENPVKAKLVDTPEKYPLSGSLIWPQWQQAYQEPNSGLG